MSIIHDALKKVQEGLIPKTEEAQQAGPSPTAPGASAYLYKKAADVKPKNKIQSVFFVTCTLLITSAITIASIEYICQQFQTSIPQVQNFAQKSFLKLIHKKEPPAFKTMAPEDLKPLAQITTKSPAPVTLNIHGIMSNGTRNLVLINDQVYQEGDEVDGTKIVKINLNSITVDNNGIEQTILVKN